MHIPVAKAALSIAKTFAGFSFSLYVLHFPLLLLIWAIWSPGTRWQPDIRHLLFATAIAIGVVLYAFVIASGTEFRTPVIRNWFRRTPLRQPVRYPE